VAEAYANNRMSIYLGCSEAEVVEKYYAANPHWRKWVDEHVAKGTCIDAVGALQRSRVGRSTIHSNELERAARELFSDPPGPKPGRKTIKELFRVYLDEVWNRADAPKGRGKIAWTARILAEIPAFREAGHKVASIERELRGLAPSAAGETA